MFFRRSRLLHVGAPIALTAQSTLLATNNPGAGTIAIASLALTAPESEDRVLILIGQNATTGDPDAISWGGQQVNILHRVTMQGARYFVASARAPRNTTAPISILTSEGFCQAKFQAMTVTGLADPNLVDVQSSATAADVTRSVDLNTKSGGLVVALAINNITAAQSATWSGDQTPTEQNETSSGERFTYATTLNTNEDAANTVTVTFGVISTTSCSLLAASFR